MFLPKPTEQISYESVSDWYNNIREELESSSLNNVQKECVARYYSGAGLLKVWRQPFFEHHYVRPLVRVIGEIFSEGASPRILDLGCGYGTQSLLFAMLGAEVVAVDLDARAIEIFQERIFFYEKLTDRKLRIQTYVKDVFSIGVEKWALFDAVYSLFAFNMMQPSTDLVTILSPQLRNTGVFVIQDGNRRHFFNKIYRPRSVLSNSELRQVFQSAGFGLVKQIGLCAIPPIGWRLLPQPVAQCLDKFLTRFERLSISYLHISRRELGNN